MNAKRGIIAGLLGVLLFTAAGCSDKNNIPSGILSREKMEGVLWDMIQADQYSTLYLAKDSARMAKDSTHLAKDSTHLAKDSTRINLKMETLRLYEQVFRLHQVSREEFRKSYQYYLDHPALNQVLFDSLTVKGARLRTESYSRPVPFRPIPQVPVPSQLAPAHGPAPSIPATSIPAPSIPGHSIPGHSLPGHSHVPAFPFRPSGAKSIFHPGKKDSTRRPA
jgi:Domain of unknown function (DUF4296)